MAATREGRQDSLNLPCSVNLPSLAKSASMTSMMRSDGHQRPHSSSHSSSISRVSATQAASYRS